MWRIVSYIASAGLLAACGLSMTSQEAQARPQYLKQFITQYPDLADAAKMKKCGVCHPKNKKMRLDYGQAVADGLGEDEDGEQNKNVKDAKAIEKALKKAAEVESKETGKTFGEMIEAGKLPE